MSGGLGRSFSFADNDEESLNPGRNHGYRSSPPLPPAYTDSPARQYHNPPPPPPPPEYQSAYGTSYDTTPLNTNIDGHRDLGHSASNRTASTTTPGADNMGESAAGGGIAGVALGIANTHARDSGLQAVRSIESFDEVGAGIPRERGFDTVGSDTPYIPNPPPSNRNSYIRDPFASAAPSRLSNPFEDGRRGSLPPSPGSVTPRAHRSRDSVPLNDYPQNAYAHSRGSSYRDNPYNRFSTAWDPMVARGDIDPNAIDDDGEDAIAPGHGRPGSGLDARNIGPDSTRAAGDTAASGVLGALGGILGRKHGPNGVRDTSGQYGPVGDPAPELRAVEKSEWLSHQTSRRKRLQWIVGIIIGLIIIGAIVGGVIGGLHHSSSSNSHDSSTSPSSSPGKDSGSDLDLNSAAIKKLMNNPNLHKVFPGVDYTPFNAQYPACLTNPPSQANVTKDVAVLSQLTNTIRLYGTDCNQTEMVLHAIDKLALKNIKVWIGVWLDKNSTTNDRGMTAMYDILSKQGTSPFAGVIVGNEVLFREDMTITQLSDILTSVKQNFTNLKYDLPVATSDIGDKWTAELAGKVDYVMSNIHPFFGGIPIDQAAGWTWNFWQGHDVILTSAASKVKQVVSEVGWPSAGGTDCGNEQNTCPKGMGAVAGVDEMNKFMGDYVCQSLQNGTDFFW